MLRRGLAFCIVTGIATVAQAGAVITLVPNPQKSCYQPQEQVTINVMLTQAPGGTDHYLRYTQLDFSETTPGLRTNIALPVTHDLATDIRFWNFNGIPNCPTPNTPTCGAGHYLEQTLNGPRPNVLSRTYFFTDPANLVTNPNAQPLMTGGSNPTPLLLGQLVIVVPPPGDYTLNVLSAGQSNPDLGGAHVRFGFGTDVTPDPVTKWHAGTDLTGGTLNIHVENECPTCANLIAVAPADQRSLWRTARNIIRLTFDQNITGPPTGLEINEMIADPGCDGPGTFGPNLAAGFTFTVENDPNQGDQPRILKIQETSTTGGPLVHRKWYAVRNPGTSGQPGAWASACSFGTSGDGPAQFIVQAGDVNDSLTVTTADAGVVYSQVPCLSGCGDARRADVNGDSRITTADAGLVYSKVLSLSVTKPCGH